MNCSENAYFAFPCKPETTDRAEKPHLYTFLNKFVQSFAWLSEDIFFGAIQHEDTCGRLVSVNIQWIKLQNGCKSEKIILR